MTPTEARLRYVDAALARRGKPVLWAAKGDYFINEQDVRVELPPDTAFDCSGLGTVAFKAIGGEDLRAAWNAQRFSDELPCVAEPEPGDFGVYGRDLQHVIHVVIALAGGHVLSADGATSKVRSLAQAVHRKAEVRVHKGTDWYHAAPFLGWRRNTLIDALVKGSP